RLVLSDAEHDFVDFVAPFVEDRLELVRAFRLRDVRAKLLATGRGWFGHTGSRVARLAIALEEPVSRQRLASLELLGQVLILPGGLRVLFAVEEFLGLAGPLHFLLFPRLSHVPQRSAAADHD